jgi:glucose-1-phosphate adenylyltransferase
MFVLTQFNSHALNAHLARTYPPSLFGGPPGSQGFVDVLACHQTADDASWYAGSADAVRRNLDALLEPVNGGRPPREVVVLSGHALADVDFAGLVRAHRAAGSAVTLATRSVPADRASRLGLVRVDPGTGAVTDFAEKPTGAAMERLAHASAHATPDAPYEASTGVYGEFGVCFGFVRARPPLSFHPKPLTTHHLPFPSLPLLPLSFRRRRPAQPARHARRRRLRRRRVRRPALRL